MGEGALAMTVFPSPVAARVASRYVGRKAMAYDDNRADLAKWEGEDRGVRSMLSGLPAGTTLVDIPCGTGRFIPFYHERGFTVRCLDISEAMLGELAKLTIDTRLIEFAPGNIFAIDAADRSFDVALSIRFLNLIGETDMQAALRELQRVARVRVVFTLRVKVDVPSGRYHSAYPMSSVEAALLEGWRVSRGDALHEHDYRLIELRRE